MSTAFLAILEEGGVRYARRVQVTQAIQKSLTDEFERQAVEFLHHRERGEDSGAKPIQIESERIPFFPIYSLNDSSQIFEVEGFKIDAFILNAAKSPSSVDPLIMSDDVAKRIKAFCSVEGSGVNVVIRFQAFDKRQSLIQGGWTFLQDNKSFHRLKESGFTLGNKIHAVYDKGTLLFRSYTQAARCIAMATLFDEASNDRVEEVLDHDLLDVSDKASILGNADSNMRKQFAAIAALGVLDNAVPADVKKAAKEFDIDLEVAKKGGKDRLVFPAEKKDQKSLLRLLTESYYVGPVTGEKFQSNSHRPLDSNAAQKSPKTKSPNASPTKKTAKKKAKKKKM